MLVVHDLTSKLEAASFAMCYVVLLFILLFSSFNLVLACCTANVATPTD